jgi:hypothetical protein
MEQDEQPTKTRLTARLFAAAPASIIRARASIHVHGASVVGKQSGRAVRGAVGATDFTHASLPTRQCLPEMIDDRDCPGYGRAVDRGLAVRS